MSICANSNSNIGSGLRRYVTEHFWNTNATPLHVKVLNMLHFDRKFWLFSKMYIFTWAKL